MKTLKEILASRWFQFFWMPVLVLVWFIWTDPSGGADTALRIQLAAQALMLTGLSYLISKALLGKTSSEHLYREAAAGTTSAGLAYIGVCILRAMVLLGLLIFFGTVQR